MNQLSEILKNGRDRKGFSQQEVANKAGIKQRAYGFYENGEREPDLKTLKSIIKVLDVWQEFYAYLLDHNVPQETNGSDQIVLNAEYLRGKLESKEEVLREKEARRLETEHRAKNAEEREKHLLSMLNSGLGKILPDLATVVAYQKAWVKYEAEKEAKGDKVKKQSILDTMGKFVDEIVNPKTNYVGGKGQKHT